MRSLFTLGTIVLAIVVPWSSLAPTWLPDASGSSITLNSTRDSGPVARLNPGLGIFPLTEDSTGPEAEGPGNHQVSDQPPGLTLASSTASCGKRVVCEDGVCRLVGESSEAPGAAVTGRDDASHDELRERLTSFGAMRLRVESDGDGGEARVSCFMSAKPGSKVLKWFKATGTDESEALGCVLKQIETWLEDSQ